MTMLLEPTGRELFMVLCLKMSGLKLVAEEEHFTELQSVESVSFKLPKEVIKSLGQEYLNLQFGTVQYRGGKNNILNNQIEAVTLRLYLNPFKALDMEQVLESQVKYRSMILNQNYHTYYEYRFTASYDYIDYDIDFLFYRIEKGLKNNLGHIYNELPINPLPDWINQLPCYK
jgi:hypothetical protein